MTPKRRKALHTQDSRDDSPYDGEWNRSTSVHERTSTRRVCAMSRSCLWETTSRSFPHPILQRFPGNCSADCSSRRHGLPHRKGNLHLRALPTTTKHRVRSTIRRCLEDVVLSTLAFPPIGVCRTQGHEIGLKALVPLLVPFFSQ